MCVKTERLIVRKIKTGDWIDLKNIAADFSKSKYALYDMPFPEKDSELRVLTEQFANSGLFFVVLLEPSKKMIGYVCFHENNGNFDLGYCFHSAYQGKGYAFESCQASMRYVEQNYKVKNFTAGTALNNIPSCKLLERLGFVIKETEWVSFCKDQNGNDIVFEGGVFIKRK